MPYVTVRLTPRTHQLSLFDILDHEIDVSDLPFDPRVTTGTRTEWLENIPDRLKGREGYMTGLLNAFNEKYRKLFERDRESLYTTFYIPKKTHGLRRIDAPCDELMAALRELKDILENKFGMLYHTSAFAYVKGRSTIDAVKRHQFNQSKWFLKTDFSNFFGSVTEEFLFRMFTSLYPTSELAKTPAGAEALRKALSLCFLRGGLPQGTPISPTLTNLMMIPIDHALYNHYRKEHFVYTRYADDILLSTRVSFRFMDQVRFINETLEKFGAPFKIKDEKTRYGSSSGSNWNLGVMLNGDNEITIGWRNVQRYKAMCNSFILDTMHHVKWEPHDLQVFQGLTSYYIMVDRDRINQIIAAFNTKYHVDMRAMLKAALSAKE